MHTVPGTSFEWHDVHRFRRQIGLHPDTGYTAPECRACCTAQNKEQSRDGITTFQGIQSTLQRNLVPKYSAFQLPQDYKRGTINPAFYLRHHRLILNPTVFNTQPLEPDTLLIYILIQSSITQS